MKGLYKSILHYQGEDACWTKRSDRDHTKQNNKNNIAEDFMEGMFLNQKGFYESLDVEHRCTKCIKVEVGGLVFSIMSQNDDIYKYVKEWNCVETDGYDYRIILLNMTRESLDEIVNQNVENEKQDFLIFEANEDCFFAMSKERTEGYVINTNLGSDEWGAPLFERVRWHIATHIFYACEKEQKIAFHASAVEKDNNVVILLGEKAKGKSTQTARLVNEGWNFISDDRVLVSVANGRISIEPFWNSIKIRSDVTNRTDIEWVEEKTEIEESYYEDPDFGYSMRRICKSDIKQVFPTKILAFFLNDISDEVQVMQPSKAMIDMMNSYILFGALWDEVKTRKCIFEIANTFVKEATCICMDVKTDKFMNVVNEYFTCE